ncbi:type III PLP-dependent enzyme [Gordonia sp. NPDC003424]
MRSAFREQVVTDLRAAAAAGRWREHVVAHGTPLLLFDPVELAHSYRRLATAMPDVAWHFAIKAQPHPRVLSILAALGGRFDVASRSETDLVRALDIPMSHCLYSNPHRTRADIAHAAGAGVRRFVVDTPGALAKLAGVEGVRVLMRLATPRANAHTDLSTKFGATAEEVVSLVKMALSLGIMVEGLCLHVGSQCTRPESFGRAIAAAIGLVDHLDRTTGVRLTVLDIGGGFPVAYTEHVPHVGAIASHVDAAFGRRRGEFEILAEPGRYLAASSMTLITSVVGTSTRKGREWRFLDDGIYGTYSNVLTEQITPALVAGSEVFDGATPTTSMMLAGPTCDSIDVIVADHPMPPLDEGDLVISPMMGAYTTATASRFNGFGAAPIVEVYDDVRASPGIADWLDLPTGIH